MQGTFSMLMLRGSLRPLACRAALLCPAVAHTTRYFCTKPWHQMHSSAVATSPIFSQMGKMCPNRQLLQRSAHTVAETCRLSSNVWAKMTGRGVLRVVGADAITFLQGLTTNDMKPLGSGPKAVSAAFLNAQGRVILDAILYSADGETIFIDVAAEKAAELASLLKKYKLRAKVKISDASSELGVWVALGPDVGRWWVQETDKNKTPADDGSFIFQDPRHLDLGIRAIAPLASDGPVQSFLKANPAWLEVPETQCDMFRLSLGVAEGPAEFVAGKSMPLEANLDMFSGVSFNKGCYIGQELTARTHFRGQVRKRLVPFILAGSGEAVKGWELPGELAGAMAYSGESPKPDDVVARDGKQIGKVVSCRGGVGIAMMLGKEEELTGLDIGGKKGSVLLPVWWTVVQEQANEQQSVQD